MSKLKTLFGLILAACVIMGLALPLCEAAGKDSSETRIKDLHVSVKGNRTRLIFDAEGAKPKQIGPESADGISVFFARITAKLSDKVIRDGKAAASEVKFRRESGFFEVLFRQKNVSVASSVRDEKNGRYTLTLDLTPSGKPAAAEPSGEPAPKSGAKRLHLNPKGLKPPNSSAPKQPSRSRTPWPSSVRPNQTSLHALPRSPGRLRKPAPIPLPSIRAPVNCSKTAPETSCFALRK